jgi:iron complex outermembrane receptor protein
MRMHSTQAARAAASFSVLLSLAAAGVLAAEPPHDDTEHRDVIVVTASPVAKSQDELAEAVNVLDRDHLQSHGGTTLGEALDGEPGIASSGFAPGASRPVIRGLDSFRVRVLQDGLGTHGVAEISADHGEAINPLSAQRVEVVRGPATLRYGGGAIGGVVNAITNRIPAGPIDELVRGDLFGGYGSVAEDRMFAGEAEGGYGPLAWHVDGLRRASDDYGLPSSGDTQDNTGTDLYALGGGAAWVGSRGRLGVGYGRYVDDYGISEPEDPDNAPTIELESQSFDSQADLEVARFGLGTVRWRGRYTDYTHDEVVQGDALSTFDADTWEGRLETLHDPLAGFGGAVGFHFLSRELKARGEGSELLAPADTQSYAGYLFEDYDLAEQLRLELGGRVEHTRVDGTAPPPPDGSGNDRGRRFTPLSGSAGLVWSAAEPLTLGLTLSAAQRAPDALELFAKGPHEADATFQRGDPDADAETAYSAEWNASAHLERLSLHGALFYAYYDGFVFGRLTGQSCDEDGACAPGPGGELDELVYTQEDAHFAGFELEGEAPIWRFGDLGEVGLDAQVDWVRAWLDGGHNVPRMPPLRWGSGVYFAGERVRARVGFLRHERQWFQGQFETETAGYTMLDASTSVRLFGDEGRGLFLDLGGDNLNDARARNHVSFKKDDQRLPGRNLRVGLRGTF